MRRIRAIEKYGKNGFRKDGDKIRLEAYGHNYVKAEDKWMEEVYDDNDVMTLAPVSIAVKTCLETHLSKVKTLPETSVF